jgi:hypothetical protein
LLNEQLNIKYGMNMYSREQLIGQWHRSDSNGAENFSELAQLNDDGSFTFTFYTYNLEGSVVDEISELGMWGLVGDLHFTITEAEVENQQHFKADMTDNDNYHAYRVLALSDDNFTYEHVVTGEKFTLFKVQANANKN